jgi:hypothetical protein
MRSTKTGQYQPEPAEAQRDVRAAVGQSLGRGRRREHERDGCAGEREADAGGELEQVRGDEREEQARGRAGEKAHRPGGDERRAPEAAPTETP